MPHEPTCPSAFPDHAAARVEDRAAALAKLSGVEEVADAVRRVVDALVRAGDVVTDRSAELAARLHAVAAEIEDAAPPPAERLLEMWRPNRPRRHDPVAGTENPLAPPLRVRREPDGAVHGTVTLGWPYQGPTGLVHGGVSALLLDHVLGLSNAWAGTPGMTAQLELNFTRPVPLDTELTVTARQVSVDGRKMRARGVISDGDGPLVSAKGLFLQPQPATPSAGQPAAEPGAAP